MDMHFQFRYLGVKVSPLFAGVTVLQKGTVKKRFITGN